jgi:hypothetical protein
MLTTETVTELFQSTFSVKCDPFIPKINPSQNPWPEFAKQLETYQQCTNQHFSIQGQSVQFYNRTSKNKKLPLCLEFAFKRIICSHGLPARERGNGLRTSHSKKPCGCQMRFRAIPVLVERVGEKELYTIKITSASYLHENHPVSKGAYEHYTTQRKINEPDAIEAVKIAMKTGGKTSKLRNHLQNMTSKCFESFYTISANVR